MYFRVVLFFLFCAHWHGFCQCYFIYPEIDLGEVDLSSNPKCKELLDPFLTECTNEYRYNVQKAMEKADFNVSSDIVRKVTCCGVLRAQKCMSKAARSQPECNIKEARAFEKLPINSDSIGVVNRECVGRYYSHKQCSAPDSVSGTTLSQLLFLSSLFITILIQRLGI